MPLFVLTETVTEVRKYQVNLDNANPDIDEIRDAAYKQTPRIKFAEVEDVEVMRYMHDEAPGEEYDPD